MLLSVFNVPFLASAFLLLFPVATPTVVRPFAECVIASVLLWIVLPCVIDVGKVGLHAVYSIHKVAFLVLQLLLFKVGLFLLLFISFLLLCLCDVLLGFRNLVLCFCGSVKNLLFLLLLQAKYLGVHPVCRCGQLHLRLFQVKLCLYALFRIASQAFDHIEVLLQCVIVCVLGLLDLKCARPLCVSQLIA